MTDNGSSERVSPSTGPRSASTDHTQAVRLATERPKITRLSRKILAGGSTLALLLVAGAVLWALGNPPHNPALGELYSTDHHNVADGLTKLPQDYGGVSHETTRSGPPKLGDPAPASATAASAIGLDAEQQRANQET